MIKRHWNDQSTSVCRLSDSLWTKCDRKERSQHFGCTEATKRTAYTICWRRQRLSYPLSACWCTHFQCPPTYIKEPKPRVAIKGYDVLVTINLWVESTARSSNLIIRVATVIFKRDWWLGCNHCTSVAYRGEGESPPPPKFRRSSKIVPNSTRLWKLLKIAEIRTPTPQDVRKKGSKILKLPSVRNCFILAMTNKLVVIINSLRVPKINKILLFEMKYLVPNYSCLQNTWLGGYCPQIPVLSVRCPQLNLLNPPRTKFLGTPLLYNHWKETKGVKNKMMKTETEPKKAIVRRG